MLAFYLVQCHLVPLHGLPYSVQALLQTDNAATRPNTLPRTHRHRCSELQFGTLLRTGGGQRRGQARPLERRIEAQLLSTTPSAGSPESSRISTSSGPLELCC
jgi:hypothetical protein